MCLGEDPVADRLVQLARDRGLQNGTSVGVEERPDRQFRQTCEIWGVDRSASRSRFRRVLTDLKEGVDALRASRGLMLAFGQVSIAVLVLSTMVVGYGNYLGTLPAS